MLLDEFVTEYICPNSLIRLWIPMSGGGYKIAFREDKSKPGNIDDVCMNWEFIERKHWLSGYKDYRVIGVKDVAVGFYREAINIVIEPLGGIV